ncbi:MAG: putative AlkP superfamily pyrophosphatase or phosphodiesterase [Candidatus Azotimanducaceae bacterium]|jgi:predicted AlkP superfamily pyrophosphatase or phosphodiesterase
MSNFRYYMLASLLSAALPVAAAPAISSFTSDALSDQLIDKPALVVVVSIDQMRRDRLDPEMPGGIGKILQGRQFTESQLDHASTTTCPGHVVMLTGANPSTAGVPGNSFVDRTTFEGRYCVDDRDDAYRVLDGDDNRSPRNIRSTALGDWMKEADTGSRVFSVGGKDRSTIALGGQHPDGAFWYNRMTGNFTSSGYYTDQLPAYVSTFNGDVPEVDGYIATLPERWEHPVSEFRADDYEGESEKFLRVSGHPIRSGDDIYAQIYASPYLDKQTLALAAIVAKEEKLGEGASTDLLTIALAATDIVGHSYGPRSAESVDALIKLDLWLGEFLAELEGRLGEGRVLVALSADHGVAELPEYLTNTNQNQCPEQGRVSVNGFIAALYWNIYREWTFPFTRPDDLVVFGGTSFTINTDTLQALELEQSEVVAWLDDYLSDQPIVEAAWTRNEIENGTSEVARLLRNSLVLDRSGDVMVQLAADCVLRPDSGTTHGSVYGYDRDVPMVFYGWGVSAGQIPGTAHTVDIGPSLAHHLGISMPKGLDGRVHPL